MYTNSLLWFIVKLYMYISMYSRSNLNSTTCIEMVTNWFQIHFLWSPFHSIFLSYLTFKLLITTEWKFLYSTLNLYTAAYFSLVEKKIERKLKTFTYTHHSKEEKVFSDAILNNVSWERLGVWTQAFYHPLVRLLLFKVQVTIFRG